MIVAPNTPPSRTRGVSEQVVPRYLAALATPLLLWGVACSDESSHNGIAPDPVSPTGAAGYSGESQLSEASGATPGLLPPRATAPEVPALIAEPAEEVVRDKAPAEEAQVGGCGSTKVEAKLVREPVDIILVVDNSGSMANEIIAVQKNINVNFANILGGADMDYRVLLIARHGDALSDNSICIEAPLSGAASCSPPPTTAVFTDRFFQYNMKIDSNDTFDKLIGAYRAPFADTIFRDKSGMAAEGWNAYLRQGVRKVFLELTDDHPEGMTWQEFDRQLLSLDTIQFGTESARNYTWHSIVGMAAKPNPNEAWLPSEPIQEDLCGNSDDVEEAGIPYQELSRLTGGLRFPLCRPEAYDVVFQRIATDVITRAEVACDFPIPAPPDGKALDLEKVAVSYTESVGATPKTYAQAPDLQDCRADAFYIADETISLCPETCSLLRGNPTALIDVLFTCESTLIKIGQAK